MPVLSDNALTVLKSRYLLKDEKGKITETPEQLFRRVAKYIASAEKLFPKRQVEINYEDIFFDVMNNLLFLPNTPTLMNAGTNNNQLSACFVLPVEDSIEGIFKTLHHAALIQKSGGGTGFNFSAIRPEDDPASFPGYTAAGPVSFMKIYDAATEQIRQGGKRRGANMGILDISHPDIEKFISAKSEEGILSNFNISVNVSDAFMKAVRDNKNHNLVNPRTGKKVKTVKARQLWEKIIQYAHQTGDPGLVFSDTINKTNPTPVIGKINCTNPCGEVPLLDYEPCNLGSLNIYKMIKGSRIDWRLLEKTIFTAIRFLDNVIEVNNYVIPQIEKMAKGNRKIGLGVMGWADALIRMKIPYASERALKLSEKLMQFISNKSFEASALLAKERGVFPNWNKSIYYPDRPVRNATRTSIAPTGTISIIAGVSPSIEPVFALFLRRKNILDGKTLDEINPAFLEFMKEKGYTSVKEIEKRISTGNLKTTKGISEKEKKLFLTAHEIDYLFHLKHQIAFQKYTDNAVSKTINMPEKAGEKDVQKAYLYAWKHKAKGITVFREGSRRKQVLNTRLFKRREENNGITCDC